MYVISTVEEVWVSCRHCGLKWMDVGICGAGKDNCDPGAKVIIALRIVTKLVDESKQGIAG